MPIRHTGAYRQREDTEIVANRCCRSPCHRSQDVRTHNARFAVSSLAANQTADHVQDSTVTDLGVVLDNQLSMQAQVAAVCRSRFYQLRQLRVVQRSLTRDVLQSLVQAFVHCRLDYCNAILTGAADGQIRRLQAVQNAAARLVSGARRRHSVSPILRSLHWLPVRRRVIFKSAIIAWKCVNGVAPTYLRELCV